MNWAKKIWLDVPSYKKVNYFIWAKYQKDGPKYIYNKYLHLLKAYAQKS